LAALADLLERGDLDAWRPIARVIARDPGGDLAARVMRLVDAYPLYGTSPLWRAWIERCRARAESEASGAPAVDLAALRRRRGLTQAQVAKRMRMSQSDLSKLERRPDVRLSTLRLFARALGGRLETQYVSGAQRIEIRAAEPG
jgi:DNA-binding Xre family transcriptional regulator